jgi:hypothetical protein
MDSIGFGVGHTMEYGRYLEEAHDREYAICAKAVEHHMGAVKRAIREIELRGISEENLFAHIEGILSDTCLGLAAMTEQWAQRNKEWDYQTGDAELGLTGLVVEDGIARAI